MNVIRDYKEWNDALWRYFFPVGDESPILYIDDNIIQQIASKSLLRIGILGMVTLIVLPNNGMIFLYFYVEGSWGILLHILLCCVL